MDLPFAKLDASGNDFVLVDGRAGLPADRAELARDLCRRRRSVGADGLIVVEPGPTRELTVAHYEPDGARTFCLNALRGVLAWAGEARALRSDAGLHEARALGSDRFAVSLPAPRSTRPVSIDGLAAVFVDVGNPQLVVEVDDLEAPDLMARGRALRWRTDLFPGGTNVDFVLRAGPGLRVRTFERGVEDETLSCGSGVVASAWALLRASSTVDGPRHGPEPRTPHDSEPAAGPGRVEVLTRGGEVQAVTIELDRVWSEGAAQVVARGVARVERRRAA